jgi:hypothetical protein
VGCGAIVRVAIREDRLIYATLEAQCADAVEVITTE